MGFNVDGTPDYQRSINGLWGQLKTKSVGRTITSSIEVSNRDLTIQPYDAGKVAVNGDDNALTTADNLNDAAAKGMSNSVLRVPLYRGRIVNQNTGEDERYELMPDGVKGTGKGSGVHIYYSPNVDDDQTGHAPDERLLHELVHALRIMQGRRNTVPTEDTVRNYDNEEEFLAIVVTNVYISAKGKSKLRADHHGHTELRPPLNTSAGFLSDPGNWNLMNIYKLIWQPTFWLLSLETEATFNPFREITARLAYLTGGRPFQ
jgi:hypothetical protein